MAKFSLGQPVVYSNKGLKMDSLEAEIIAIDDYDYILKFDENRPRHWACGSGEIHHRHEFIPTEFNPNGTYRVSISRHCLRVGKSSRGIQSPILQYDPTQQGDRDDDI